MAGLLNTSFDILTTKCPNCRKGKMFKYPVYRVSRLLKVRDHCPVCGQDFRQEPGFYLGSMYFSYAINIIIIIAFGVSYELLVDPEENWKTLLSVFAPPVLLIPFTFRVSRVVNLYMLGNLKKKK